MKKKSESSVTCHRKAPLVIGTDVTNTTADVLEILKNKVAIEINQDPLGKQGTLRVRTDTVRGVPKACAHCRVDSGMGWGA